MVGLRTQESTKFLKFWEIVQQSANSLGKTFFLDCGEGNLFSDNEIECENLSGWLIDNDKVSEFEKEFLSKKNIDEKWTDCVVFADWEKNGNVISVSFDFLNYN